MCAETGWRMGFCQWGDDGFPQPWLQNWLAGAESSCNALAVSRQKTTASSLQPHHSGAQARPIANALSKQNQNTWGRWNMGVSISEWERIRVQAWACRWRSSIDKGFRVLQERIALLSFCSYVQWVPDSDVVVAQVPTQIVSRVYMHCKPLVKRHETKKNWHRRLKQQTNLAVFHVIFHSFAMAIDLAMDSWCCFNRTVIFTLSCNGHWSRFDAQLQNRGNLYVWYSLKNPEQATIFPIKVCCLASEREQHQNPKSFEKGLEC